MQLGFLLLESGVVPANHMKTIMLKNTVPDSCVGAVGWLFIGFRIYSGATGLPNDTTSYVDWMQSYVFAITTSTIVSGGVACRMTLLPYVVYSLIVCAWVYAVAARWAWAGGWPICPFWIFWSRASACYRGYLCIDRENFALVPTEKIMPRPCHLKPWR